MRGLSDQDLRKILSELEKKIPLGFVEPGTIHPSTQVQSFA